MVTLCAGMVRSSSVRSSARSRAEEAPPPLVAAVCEASRSIRSMKGLVRASEGARAKVLAALAAYESGPAR